MRYETAQYWVHHSDEAVHVQLKEPCWILSSAVLNGGLVQANHILNLRVAKNRDGDKGPFDPSEVTLQNYGIERGWEGLTVGMMTAADADSFRRASRVEQGVEVTALVTVGISNARRAGDRAECRDHFNPEAETGTINMILLTNAVLKRPALVEAIITVTEAKAAALQDLGVRNPETGGIATGTGTDAVAVVSGPGPARIRYCGKHMLFGEMLASTVMGAIAASLKR